MSSLRIDSAGVEALLRSETAIPAPPTKADAAGFGDRLGEAVRALDGLQTSADASAHALAMGAGNLHETALALEKADVAMRLATRVRNKLVDAYNEVMRMSV